jgi:hypothetical protein
MASYEEQMEQMEEQREECLNGRHMTPDGPNKNLVNGKLVFSWYCPNCFEQLGVEVID